MPFEGFDFSGFWNDCDYAMEEYICSPPADELIAQIEKELGYKLPESYIWLMKQHNGGIPVNTCFPTDEPTSWAEDHIAITGIMGIGRERSCAICGELGSRFMIEEWEYPDIGVAICDCPSAGHDMVFLDYRECGPKGEPRVVHVDQEDDYHITVLADNFEEFICGLVNEDIYDTFEEDKYHDLEMVGTAPFSPFLSALCAACDRPELVERQIRRIAAEIVEDKGFFALHKDADSMLLYDIQFWLYTNMYTEVSQEKYMADYPDMIAFGGEFSTGGYAPDFVRDWLEQRIGEGGIRRTDGRLYMTGEARKRLLEKLK